MARKIAPKSTSSAQAVSIALPPQTEALEVVQLPDPIIEFAANNNLLYPIDAINGTTATLTLPPGATDVKFYMAIKGQNEPAFEPFSVANGVKVVDIPAQLISYCIGHTVLFSYRAIVGGRVQESNTLELAVQQIREEHLVVSRPKFAHSKEELPNTWRLRISKLEGGDETVEIKAWPMIYPGQRLFVTVAGNQHVVPYRFIWVALDHVVQAHEAYEGHVFEFALSRHWLSRLDDYSTITAHSGVIWDTTAPVYPAPGDPLYENPLPVNAEDFHLRTSSAVLVDTTLVLNSPHLLESVEHPAGHWQVNPVNTVNGGHAIVSYDGMFENDHVCAYASGPDYGPVALGCKDVSKGQTSLSFDVAPHIIAALFNKTMVLNYSVQFSDYQPQSSLPRPVKVLAPQLTLPCIEEATVGIVDLNTFTGNATGVVPIWDYAQEGECCWMWVSGTCEDGSDYRFDVLRDQPLTAQWLANGVNAPIARNELKKFADCKNFELHFAASFYGKCNRATAFEFPVRVFSISQQYLVLNAPTVTEAVGSELTPWNGKKGVHVEAAYEGRQSSHQHTAQWCLEGEDNCWSLPLQKNTSCPVTFLASREQVITSFRKTALITYTVINACRQMVSETLELQVGEPLMQRRPRPVVKQATGGILDLRTFPGKDAEVIVKSTDADVDWAWWFFMVGHFAMMTLEGTAEDGSPITLSIMARLLESGDRDGLSCLIPHSDLEKLKRSTSITLNFSHFIGSDPAASVEIDFQPLTLAFTKALYDLTDFDPSGKGWNGWERGAGAADPRDLALRNDPFGGRTGYWLRDYSYTDTSDPVTESEKMFKIFTDLESGRSYRFSALVCNSSGQGANPRVALAVDRKKITSEIEPPATSWQTLEGVFVATSSTARLSVNNHRMGYQVGNDFGVTLLKLEEV
ncbi:hypothetical protein [Pseudomonas sp.]|uniref:hypothetical protein n=1 Tax=Pseudomonas sp. TaxID=306 RepID=UPI0026262920|nr:hypothetical protein [Pseudomonas sp.]